MSDPIEETARLDIWLWRARFFKTRSLAQAHIVARGVRLTRHGMTRRITKPATPVGHGDVLTFSGRQLIQTVEIVSIGTRRGPASEAASLYARLESDH